MTEELITFQSRSTTTEWVTTRLSLIRAVVREDDGRSYLYSLYIAGIEHPFKITEKTADDLQIRLINYVGRLETEQRVA